MSLHLIHVDNACLANKIELRRRATATLANLNVLDLYAGNNILWSHFQKGRYYGVDIEKSKGKNLTADSKKVVGSLDLSAFNVIDCDSYGIPFDVILRLFQNPTLQNGTIIIYTAITNSMIGLNLECMKMYGVGEIYKKCHYLIAAKALDMFYGMLYNYGVKEATYYEVTGNFTKHYGYFHYNETDKEHIHVSYIRTERQSERI